jgi:hypothetical protein
MQDYFVSMFGLVIVSRYRTAQKQKLKNNKLLVGWPLDGRLGQEGFQQKSTRTILARIFLTPLLHFICPLLLNYN